MHFAFFGRRGIKSARLCQEDWHRVTVELVVTPEFTASEKEAVLRTLEQKTLGKLHYEVRLVDRIVQETPGKFKFVVSRLGSEIGGAGNHRDAPVESCVQGVR
jgi:hypothetical protein